KRPDRAAEGALVCRPVVALDRGLVIVLPFVERDRPRKVEISVDVGVEVVRAARIGSYVDNPRGREIDLPSAPAGEVAAGTARFVIDDEVAFRRFDLSKIRAREMIPLLRQVVIGRVDFGGEDSLCHECLSRKLLSLVI